jgi:hypothetical protein
MVPAGAVRSHSTDPGRTALQHRNRRIRLDRGMGRVGAVGDRAAGKTAGPPYFVSASLLCSVNLTANLVTSAP